MDKRVIVIGSKVSTSIDCVQWDGDIPNIADYDIAVINGKSVLSACGDSIRKIGATEYIIRRKKDKRLEKILVNMKTVQKKVVELLDSGGVVHALYDTPCDFVRIEKHFGSSSGRVSKIRKTLCVSTDWCPISLKIVKENGKQISVKDTRFEKFFSLFSKWSFYFDSDSLSTDDVESCLDGKYKFNPTVLPIAKNRSGKPLAIQFSYSAHRRRITTSVDKVIAESLHLPVLNYIEKPERESGTLTLLPCPPDQRVSEAMDIILSDLCGAVTGEEPPEWIKHVEMPGERKFQEDLRAKREQKASVEREIETLTKELDEHVKPRQLLFESGLALQHICESTFVRLGARIERSPVSDEFIIESRGKRALLEVKGNTKSISGRDISQLIRDIGTYGSRTGEPIHGILVGNAWRYVAVKDRNTKDKPIFPDNVVDWALEHSIGLLSTIELFKAYCGMLAGTKQAEEILDHVLNGKGIIAF